MFKKTIAVFLVFTFVWGLLIPMHADTTSVSAVAAASSSQALPDESKAKISKDTAKATALKVLKDYFGFEIDEKVFQANIQLSKGYMISSNYIWNINWNTYSSEKSIGASVTIDADTGKVTGVNRYESVNGMPLRGISVTQAEARKIADDFLKKINPAEFKQVQYMDDNVMLNLYGSYRNPNYTFRYVRKVNGILYDNNALSVDVEAATGKIVNYNNIWEDTSVFPTLEGIVSKEKAEELYRDATNLKLNYLPIRSSSHYGDIVTGVKLIYQPDYTAVNLLDAKKGIMTDWQGNTTGQQTKKDLTTEQRTALLKDIQPIKLPEKELDSNQAMEAAKALVKALYGEGYDIQTMNYAEGRENWWESRGKKTWGAQFRKPGSTPMYEDAGNILIDSQTGSLLSSYKYNYMRETSAASEEEFVPAITWEQAYTKALETIKQYFPDKLSQISTEQIHSNAAYIVDGVDIGERRYDFNFQRLVNGINYMDNSINIAFDAKNGSILDIRCIWDDNMIFPLSQNSLNKDIAKKIYLESFKPELSYVAITKAEKDAKPEILLAYVLKQQGLTYMPSNIDAVTGKFLNYDGQEFKVAGDQFDAMIKGHKEERAFSILAYQGIIDRKSFVMSNEIKKIDFIKMLVNAKGNVYYGRDDQALKFTNVTKDNANYAILQQAVAYGLIENKAVKLDLEAKLSREEMAEMLIKLLQYDKVAKAKDIFKLVYSDAAQISKERYGAVALCKGLEIFKDNGGKFRPKANATMQEAALAVYNMLSNLK